MTRTTLCVVRHGETTWNAEKRLQGHLDVPLNANGVAQAHATAALLREQRFNAIVSSDLARAAQTARVIATACALAPETSTAWRERHYGHFQGLGYADAARHHPEDYARFEQRDVHFAFRNGGESLAAFDRRIRAALAALLARHQGDRVLLVTHGGVLDILNRIARDRPLDLPRDFLIPNAALNWLSHDGQRWQVDVWAEQTHLNASRDELPNA